MNIKKIKNVFAIFCLSLISFFANAANVNALVYNANEFQAFKNRTKSEIMQEFNKLPNTEENYYETEFDFTNRIGKLKNSTHQAMTDYTNYYRWLVGVEKLDGVSTHSDDLQAGALVRNYVYENHRELLHYDIPNEYKPTDISDYIWNLGAGARNNILAWGYTPTGSISGWLDEGYSLSWQRFNTIGHRMMLIGSNVKHLDFGYYGKLAIGRYKGGYDDPKAYTAYPAPGYMPINYYGINNSAWHIEFNEDIIIVQDNVSVKVTNIDNNSSYVCNTENKLLDYYEYDWDHNTILFKQPDSVRVGDKFKVEVEGLKTLNGDDVKAEYTTEFFDITKSDTPYIKNVKFTFPTKNTYTSREFNGSDKTKLDYTGGKAIVSYSNNTSKAIDLSSDLVSGIYANDGYYNVNFKIDNFSENFEILVVPDPRNNGSFITNYGNSLEIFKLPDVNHGRYDWEADPRIIYEVGTHNTYIMFYPDNSKFSEVKFDVKVEITKANPTYEIPTNLYANANTKLSEVLLPEGWSWDNPNTNVGDKIGEREFPVTYTPSDTKNYNIINKMVKVNIIKKTPDFEVPTGLTAVYGDSLRDIELPTSENGVFSFKDNLDTKVGNAGKRVFDVVYTPNDTDNYSVVDIKVTIDVKKVVVESLEVPTSKEIVYSPSTKLDDISLPKGWSFDDGDVVPNAGRHEYKITYTPEDTNNYDYSNFDLNPTIELIVKKAKPVYADKLTLIAYKNDTLADVLLPTSDEGVYSFQDDLSTILDESGTKEFLVTFTPNDFDNYETITDIIGFVEVDKIKPEYVVPTDLTATYGDLLSDVLLPEGFNWNSPDLYVGNVGLNTFFATFTPEDTDNYAIMRNVEIKVEVKKKKADLIEIPVLDEISYDANITLKDISLSEGWSWNNSSIVPTVDVSKYGATYTPNDTDNYDYSEQDLDVMITLKVNKSDPVYEKLNTIYTYWDYNIEDITLPKGFIFKSTGKVGEIGLHTYYVDYIPEDLMNLNPVRDIPVKVYVNKAYPNVSINSELSVGQKDGMRLEDIKLPEGWKWVNPEKIVTNGRFMVVYTPDDLEHYNYLYSDITVIVTPFNNNSNAGEMITYNPSNTSSNEDKTLAASDKDDKKINNTSNDDDDDEDDDSEYDDDDEENDGESYRRKFPWWILILMIIGVGAVIGYNIMKEED